MNISTQGGGLPFLHNFRRNAIAPQNPQGDMLRSLLREAMAEQGSKTSAALAKEGEQQQSTTDKQDMPKFKPVERLKNGSIPVYAEAVTLGGKHDYTKEDAFSKMNGIVVKMDEAFLEANQIVPSIKNDITNQEEGILNSLDFIWGNIDMSYASSNVEALRQSIDQIASRYVAMKDRIDTEYVGEERVANLDRLDQMMNQYTKGLAQNFANAVGGVFEENGVEGEKEQLYQSVLAEIGKKTEAYSAFAKTKENYGNINGPEEAWLAKDSAYMASALRKTMADAGAANGEVAADSKGYTLEEMEKMQSFAKELASYTKDFSGGTKEILVGNETEESLGMKLAELSLKGTVFNKEAGVSDRIKNAVTKSIENFSKKAIEKEQQHLEKWASLQIAGYEALRGRGEISDYEAGKHITAIKKGFTAFDENGVYAVINRVQDSYKKSGNVSSAIMDGATLAKSTYEEKAKDDRFDGVHRYDNGGGYWDNFFVNTDKYSDNSYIQNQSGREGIINSWNDFMGEITDNKDVFFTEIQYTGRA